MAESSFFQVAFEEAQNLLQTEADGFAAVLQSIAGFDIVSQAGDAISIFEGAGTALLTLFFCMEAFTYCANIDFHGGIEGAIRVAMKLVVSALIVQNVDNVVGIISGLFKSEVDFASACDIGSGKHSLCSDFVCLVLKTVDCFCDLHHTKPP